MGLTESALRIWVQQAKADRGEGKPGALTTAEREELSRLRKRVRELEVERDILTELSGGEGGPANVGVDVTRWFANVASRHRT